MKEADEEKEQEMQIGFPTDVKHIAHIGWDGPSVDSPSWLKEFKAPEGFQSAPLVSPPVEPPEGHEVKWVSEDSKSKGREAISSARGSSNSDAPRASRRRSVENSESTRKGSRRQSKESSSSDSVRSSSHRQTPEQGLVGGESSSGGLSVSVPDIPKKSRRKKSKEVFNGGSSRPSRSSKPNAITISCSEAANGGSTRGSRSRSKGTTKSLTCTSPSRFSDPGPETLGGSVGSPGKDEFSRLSVITLPTNNIEEEDKGISGVS